MLDRVQSSTDVIMALLALVAYLLLPPLSSEASDLRWAEYVANPVYDPPNVVDMAYYPCVIYDAEQFSGHGASHYYKMWYGDGQGQFEAVTYSDDGVNWSDPVQTTGIRAAGYHAKVSTYIPGGYNAAGGTYYYKMWYWDSSVHDMPYTIDGIRTADSIDGVAWANDSVITQNSNAPLVTGISTDWNRGTYGPISVHHNAAASNMGTNPFDYAFAMYFDATNGGVESIGLGYSTDGNTDWRIYGSTPVLDHGIPGDWDSDYATAGVVIHGVDGMWRMWYSGSGPSGGGQQGIGYATSPNGILWTKDSGNPVFSIFQGVAWRDARCYTPAVLYSASRFDGHGEAATYKMWFTGLTSATVNMTIGYATGAALPVTVGDVYSTDENMTLNVAAPGVLGNDTDVEGHALTAVTLTDPAHGALILHADGSFSYVPTSNWNGMDSFSYKANDGTLDSNTATVTLTVNPTYTLTVVNGTGGGSYSSGTTVPVRAIVPPGDVFDSWIGDIGYLADTVAASTTVIMPAANVTVAAEFKDAPFGTFTLTVTNGSGSGAYLTGSEVTITADEPPAGQFFLTWLSDTSGLSCVSDVCSAATTVKIPSKNITLTATYKDAVPCVVTLVSNPAGVADLTISPAQTFIGQTISLNATTSVFSMYVFVRWEASGLATIDRPYTAASSVLIGGDATITALFAVKSPFQKAMLNLDNSKSNMEGASVSLAMLSMAGHQPFTFDITSDTLTALVDGVSFVMSPATGVFKQKGAKKFYTFASTPKTVPFVKLTLDIENGLCSYSVSKVDKMHEVVDSSDGVGFFLVVSKKDDLPGVFRAYGERPAMTETTSWKYAVMVNGAAVSNSGLAVTSAQGAYLGDKTKGRTDSFKANGTFAAGSGFVFDPTRDSVSVSLDGVWSQTFITFDAAALEKKKLIKSKAISELDGSHAEIVVDIGKGNWSFKMTGGNLVNVTGFDGITFEFDVGAYHGSALFKPFQKSALKYLAKERTQKEK